ncbi:MAG: orotidine-5'-phosphate decarboxylase, partial [Candidatus Anstonellales archaeon]
SSILDSNPRVCAIKPNYAFFAQYGFDGLRALKRIIDSYKKTYPVILDAKRSDIGKTSEAYAKEVFLFWGADATTVSPYLGSDTIKPFLLYKTNFSYVLCRTSNDSAREFQSLKSANLPLYLHVARKVQELDASRGLLGLVVGATAPLELEKIASTLRKPKLPLLIPGIGAQRGDLKKTMQILKKHYRERTSICLINASSSISYAYAKENAADYVGSALKEIDNLNRQIKL